MNTRGVKNEYLNNDNTSCPELINPTIDFIAPEKFRNKKIFIPHYLFMIDISESSYQLGLPSYIINSIQITLDSIHNSENSYIAFALYELFSSSRILFRSTKELLAKFDNSELSLFSFFLSVKIKLTILIIGCSISNINFMKLSPSNIL